MTDSRISKVYKRQTPDGNPKWLVLLNNGEQVFILKKKCKTPYYQWLWTTPWSTEELTDQVWGVGFVCIKPTMGSLSLPLL